jgi:hypothetical protein
MQELFGHDPDFAKLMEQIDGDQGMPPVHPGKHEEVSDSEVQANIDRKFGRNMFQMRDKFRCQYGLFDMSDAEQREELENMVNNCLQKKWLMAREEWQHLQDGRTMVSVKCLIPEDHPKKKKAGGDENV